MLFDTSAWIEFFQGTENIDKIVNILKSEENFTNIVTFAELIEWCLENNKEDKIEIYLESIKKVSKILDLDENLIIAAGRLNYNRKKILKNWGMVDSFILATSLFYNLKILTKDHHFKNLPNAEIL